MSKQQGKKRKSRDKTVRKQLEVVDELSRNPNVSFVCKKIGISRNTFYRWQKENDDFKQSVDEAQLEGDRYLNDMVESKLMKLIGEDKWSAIKYYLDKRHLKYNTHYLPSTSPRPHPRDYDHTFWREVEYCLKEDDDVDNQA